MAYPDPNLSDMSIGQLLKIIRDEVQTATPAIPKNIQRLEDSDSPLIYPNSSDDGQGLFYNSSTGKYEPTLVDAPNLAANIILASQLIAGDPNAARVEVGVNSDGDTGARSFDDTNTNTFKLDAQDGSVYVKGRIDFGTASRLLANDVVELAGQVGTGLQTPVRLQAKNKTYDGSPSGSNFSGTANVTWGSPTTAGSLLLMVVLQKNSGAANPSLPTVSGWTQIQTATVAATDGSGMRQTIFKIENSGSRSGNEGVVISSGTRYYAIRMLEYKGVATVDVTTTAATGTSTTPISSATGVLGTAGELLFGAIGTDAAFGVSPGLNKLVGDFSVFSDAGEIFAAHSPGLTLVYDITLNCFELATVATTTRSVDGTMTGSAAAYIAQLVTFTAASATSTPTTPTSGIARLYAANDVAGNPVPHALDAAGNANSVLLAPAGNKYAVEVAQATVSIPSTAAGATSTIAVSLGTLAVGDVAVWIGVSAGSAFTFYADPICTSGGSITLRYHNTDDGAAHALATQTHTFLIIHRS